MTNNRLRLMMTIHLLVTTTFVTSLRATTSHCATANHRVSRDIVPSSLYDRSIPPFETPKHSESRPSPSYDSDSDDDPCNGRDDASRGGAISMKFAVVASTFLAVCASVPPACDGAVVTTHHASSSSVSSMILLAGSTLANPIGESVATGGGGGGGGGDLATSLGQWFFRLYVVVSLLAGGKEIFGRIRKSMTDDDNR